jgi:predicted transcriptional regulator
MIAMLSIVDSLSASRKAQRLSQQDLADRAGTSRMTVVRVEAAQDPRLSTVYELARALGLELMLVPKSLSEEVQSFVRSGGKMLGQPIGASAPPSVASIASKEISQMVRINAHKVVRQGDLTESLGLSALRIPTAPTPAPAPASPTYFKSGKKIGISDEARAKMKKLSAAKGSK